MAPSFDNVYYASYRSVLRSVVLLVPTVEDAHDLTQEAFSRALARWDVVGELENPSAWVRKVAMNAAVDMTRRDRSRRAAYRLLHGRPETTPPTDGVAVDIARALTALAPGQRQVIVLHYLLDMSVEQIANDIGRPTGTVKTNLARGRTALAALLRESLEVAADA